MRDYNYILHNSYNNTKPSLPSVNLYYFTAPDLDDRQNEDQLEFQCHHHIYHIIHNLKNIVWKMEIILMKMVILVSTIFYFFLNLCIGLYSNNPTCFSLTSWCDIKKVQISLIFDSILR